ncbi:carboxymuconolactone decarboxylase family protein [uncultured Dubosiella sp.]|uniref:carboxymuconolactone decarboxylase family protein n=1 Tax=uncultured Dubosiella sp. TaxID=1937011 RepID=UPI00261506ED|nr:carboxymuconolactone decarboxylase family protein [uncultured Dubosiella sp.]
MYQDILKKYHEDLEENNGQMIFRWEYFAAEDVAGHSKLDGKTRCMAILAVLLGCQGKEEFKRMLQVALDCGVSPVQAKEIVYQATAYLGMGRVAPFYKVVDKVFKKRNIVITDDRQTTTLEDRMRKGNDIQIAYFGEGMRDSWQKAPEATAHIQKWLAANCFGDYYTRAGLTDNQREMITFCFILGQGGCENQLRGHTNGNMNLGNDHAFLVDVISQCVPFIGYPRSLNALNVVNEIQKQREENK